MRDAVTRAFDLLYAAKRNAPNSVAMSLTKHSGQWFESIMALQSEPYVEFKALIDGILEYKTSHDTETEQEHLALPHAFHHTLKVYEAAICSTLKKERDLTPLFERIFNDTRKQEEVAGIKKAQSFIEVLKPVDKKSFDALFSALSIIKFLREDRK